MDFDLKYYINCLSLNEILCSIDKNYYIKLNDIYEIVQNKNNNIKKSKIYEIEINNELLGIRIEDNKRNPKLFFDIEILIFKKNTFKLKSKLDFFYYPIKLRYKDKKIDCFNSKHFYNIPKLLSINSAKFKCKSHNKILQWFFGDFLNHIHCNDFLEIINDDDKNIKENVSLINNFNSFINKEFPDNGKFKNPTTFDANYFDYFEFFDYLNKLPGFTYYQDNNRTTMEINLESYEPFIDKLAIFFGKPGIGKSITLIKIFKYLYNHEECGTLYINCKAMHSYFNNDLSKMKKLLLDEIPYLFYEEKDKYENCKDAINKYIKNELPTFWDLIKIVITFCNNNNKKYIFVFDQYKEEIDTKDNIFSINNELRDKEKYGIIAFCSLNNKDVSYYKIDNLFGTCQMQKKS